SSLFAALFAVTVLFSTLGASCDGPTTPTIPVLKGVTIAGQPADISAMPIQMASSQYVIVTIAAPWPADLHVDVVPGGANIERVAAVETGRQQQLKDQGTPYFVVDDVDPNPNPAVWKVRVSPPPLQQCGLMPFTIAIRHVVSNSESAPLNVAFKHADSFRVIGTSGRVVALTMPNCTAIDELRL